MKLYKVEVTQWVVVYASSEHEAEVEAERVVAAGEDEPDNSYAQEISCLEELPKPWDGTCLPWGNRSEHELTIAQIFEHNAKVKSMVSNS